MMSRSRKGEEVKARLEDGQLGSRRMGANSSQLLRY